MKIVFITSRVPWPLEKGDKLRAYHQLKNLSKKNKIILCAINDTTLHPEAETELKKFCEEIHIYNISKIQIFFNLLRGLFNGLPLQVAYFTSTTANAKINTLIQEKNLTEFLRNLFVVLNMPATKKQYLRYLITWTFFPKALNGE